jgi:hypothetical protein
VAHGNTSYQQRAAEHVNAAEQQAQAEQYEPSMCHEVLYQPTLVKQAEEVGRHEATDQEPRIEAQKAQNAGLDAHESEHQSEDLSNTRTQSTNKPHSQVDPLSTSATAESGFELSEASVEADKKSMESQFAEALLEELSRTTVQQWGAQPRRDLHNPTNPKSPTPPSSASDSSMDHRSSSPEPPQQISIAIPTPKHSTPSDQARIQASSPTEQQLVNDSKDDRSEPPQGANTLRPTTHSQPPPTEQYPEMPSSPLRTSPNPKPTTTFASMVGSEAPSSASPDEEHTASETAFTAPGRAKAITKSSLEISEDFGFQAGQVKGPPPATSPDPQPPSPPPVPPPVRSRPPESAAAAADAAALMDARANAEERGKLLACSASRHKRTLSVEEIQHEMSNKILKAPSAALLVWSALIHACLARG